MGYADLSVLAMMAVIQITELPICAMTTLVLPINLCVPLVVKTPPDVSMVLVLARMFYAFLHFCGDN